jgi:Ca2+/H+ antiporter
LTLIVAALEYVKNTIVGGVLIVFFVIYIGSVVWSITQGKVAAPELSDGSSSESGDSNHEGRGISAQYDALEASPLLNLDNSASSTDRRAHSHTLIYHITLLIFGFLAICLSSYVLSHSATTLVDESGISDLLFSVIILSIATTLPEKFIAVLSGSRGHAGILVANTVGSNIFLLSLCTGILWLSTNGDFDAGSANGIELGVMVGSSVVLTGTVWLGERWSQWIGGIMLGAYVVFLVLEFTVIRR